MYKIQVTLHHIITSKDGVTFVSNIIFTLDKSVGELYDAMNVVVDAIETLGIEFNDYDLSVLEEPK